MTGRFTIKAFLLLGFLQLGAAEILRLDCKARRDHVLCLELRDSGVRNTISAANRQDRKELDKLVKQINDDRSFEADGFLNGGRAGTLVPRNGNTHYRIDQQLDSNVHGNIQFQVGGATMASCQIRYDPQEPVPQSFAESRLHKLPDFRAGQVKGRVQDGLDYSVATRHATEVQWRAIPVRIRKDEKKRTAVERVLKAQYGNNILTREFREIRESARHMTLVGLL